MFQWISHHPVLFVFALWAGLLCLCLLPFLIRGLRRRSMPDGIPHGEREPDPILTLAAMMRMRLVKRVDMRPRFVPKPHDPARSDLLAAQILADQAVAEETAGVPVHAPAPGELGYREPVRTMRVTVNQFTVLLRRGSPTYVLEARASGIDAPAYIIPEEWGEIVSALAFEVQRLREGWSVRD